MRLGLNVCLLEFLECVRDDGNRDVDHFDNISNGEFFMPAEKIANLQAGRIANHVKFPRAGGNRIFILEFF